jgi:hypothetical protein
MFSHIALFSHQNKIFNRKIETGTLCSNMKISEIQDLKLIQITRYKFLLEMQAQSEKGILRCWGNKNKCQKNYGRES